MAIEGVNYATLLAHPEVSAKFEDVMKGAIAWPVRSGFRKDDVTLALRPGSVIVQALIWPRSASVDFVRNRLATSMGDFTKQAVMRLRDSSVMSASTGAIVVKGLHIDGVVLKDVEEGTQGKFSKKPSWLIGVMMSMLFIVGFCCAWFRPKDSSFVAQEIRQEMKPFRKLPQSEITSSRDMKRRCCNDCE